MVLDRLERARAAVGRRRAADADQHDLRARLRARRRSARRCRRSRRPTRRARPRPRARARTPRPSRSRPCRRPRPARTGSAPAGPADPATSTPTVSPPSASSSASIVPSPPSATGQRSGGISPARSSPRPIAPATSAARNVPLKESGATRTGRSGTDASPHPAKLRPWRAATHRGLRAGGAEVQALQPGQGLLPAGGGDQGAARRLLRRVRRSAVLNHLRERPTVLKRYAGGIEAEPFYQKRVPGQAPARGSQTTVLQFPSGRSAEELVPVDAAHLVWGVVAGQRGLEPASGAALRPRPPRRAARRPGPDAGRVVGHHPPRGARRARRARGARAARLPQDVRLARHAHPGADRAALGLRRGAPRRAGAGARGGAARAGAGDVEVVEGAAPRGRRLRRLQPERQGPHGRERLLGPPGGGRARVLPAGLGRGRRRAEPEEHRIDTVPARLREQGDPSADIDAHAGALDALLDLARRDEEERGLEDAPWPPHFAKQPGEPKRVQPSRARND